MQPDVVVGVHDRTWTSRGAIHGFLRISLEDTGSGGRPLHKTRSIRYKNLLSGRPHPLTDGGRYPLGCGGPISWRPRSGMVRRWWIGKWLDETNDAGAN